MISYIVDIIDIIFSTRNATDVRVQICSRTGHASAHGKRLKVQGYSSRERHDAEVLRYDHK